LPNLQETLRLLELEAGGPGSGRHKLSENFTRKMNHHIFPAENMYRGIKDPKILAKFTELHKGELEFLRQAALATKGKSNDPEFNQIYKETQSYYKSQGIKEVPLFRGISSESQEGLDKETNKEASSWTSSQKIAKGFATDANYGTGGSDRPFNKVIKDTVPVSRIFMSYKSHPEAWRDSEPGTSEKEHIVRKK